LSRKKSNSRAARGAAEQRRQKAAVRRDTAGRAHLDIYRDPASGSARVSLRAAIFEGDWQNEIATASANTALGTMREQPSVARAVELARNAMGATSRLSDGLLARAPAGTVACRPGCDHCCYQVVGVTPPEALAIADHLRNDVPHTERERIAARVSEAHERARGLTSVERFSPEHPCPFLESGHCTIYAVRPLACRGMNSLSASECAKRLREPEARAAFLTNGVGSHSFLEPIRAFHAISAGLQLGLSELYHLDMQPLELTAAVHLLLTGPRSLAAEWIAGQSAFASARASDKAEDVRMRELSGVLD
jgi:Fe-S-cluster containining protein